MPCQLMLSPKEISHDRILLLQLWFAKNLSILELALPQRKQGKFYCIESYGTAVSSVVD